MSHWAELNDDNIVIDVHVVTQEFIDANPERYPGVWVETFYNNPNKTYADNRFIYNYETQDFTPPPPTPDPDPTPEA